MIKTVILPFLCLANLVTFSQSYTSYFTGNTNDIITNPASGVCMMGGATEDDDAMKWFLQRANGGDVLVLRASGSDGYNDYFYSDLGIVVNSVETIVCNNATVANETYIHDKIAKAEAIWFAGGDQWDYISYWRGTKIDSLINDGIQNRNIVIGGTSAGMAILGKYYYSAENGTITSAEAISNPYRSDATIDSATFLKNEYLTNVITDTHYDSPDRKGRQVTFLARILTDYQTVGKGIACDEYTAVCIDENGIARVYGDANYDDFAYFIQPNCELADYSPENCTANNQLQWNRNSEALKVYKIGGNSTGSKTFDLNDWKTGVGGDWQHWSIDGGV
jgi:cyanophycinase-like exopeptidase